jgi:hypothetical protein
MKRSWFAFVAIAFFVSVIALGLPTHASLPATAAPAAHRSTANAGDPQQYPVMDRIADKIIQKYQTSSCQQLAQEKGQQQMKPKSEEELRAITILHNDPQMRQAFINKIAAPIANKLFECGMIP